MLNHEKLRQYRVWSTGIVVFSCITLNRMVNYMLESPVEFSQAYGTAFAGIALALAGIIKFALEAFTKGNQKDEL